MFILPKECIIIALVLTKLILFDFVLIFLSFAHLLAPSLQPLPLCILVSLNLQGRGLHTARMPGPSRF